MLTPILTIFKIVLAMWTLLVTGNYFRSLYWGFVSVKNKVDIDALLLNKAKSLLLLEAVVGWITAIIIHFGECMMYGASTEYSANFLFVIGILFIIIAIVSAVSSIVIAWSKNKQNRSCIPIFKNLVGMSFAFAIVLWSSSWAIS